MHSLSRASSFPLRPSSLRALCLPLPFNRNISTGAKPKCVSLLISCQPLKPLLTMPALQKGWQKSRLTFCASHILRQTARSLATATPTPPLWKTIKATKKSGQQWKVVGGKISATQLHLTRICSTLRKSFLMALLFAFPHI